MEHVSSVILFSAIQALADLGSPPWQPLLPPSFAHETSTCGEMLMSGKAPCLAILIRSESADVVAWAQQDPQNLGMC